jgi:opacity protein-like surface antigen
MKKLALALVASAVTLSAANANISTGFYLGATAGYGSTTGKSTSTNAAGVVNNSSSDIGSTAANIGIIGGYGWVTGCTYFGGEIGYSFENSKVRSNDAAEKMELKRNGYFNAALRGGYLFTPNTMFYVRLGANWGKWTLNDTTLAGVANPASGSKNRMSFAPGLGLETAIHKNVLLRVEYTYEFGPRVRAKASNNAAQFANVGSIRSQSAKVGLAYKF